MSLSTLKQKIRHLIFQELQNRRTLKEQYHWELKARPNQLPPPPPWRTWLILAGRGFGKTRTGAETIRHWIHQGKSKRIALIGETLGETRSIMVEGESGLLSVFPPLERPKFSPSNRCLVWPNGAVATLFSGDHYEQLRGPQFDTAWIDELAKFRSPEKTWEQLQLALRLGSDPKCLITTTPRPHRLIQVLLEDPDVVVTRGSTFDNKDNLAPAFLKSVIKQFEGTRLGLQELYGEMVKENKNALWNQTMIRYQTPSSDFERVVIAIDPATTHHEGSDETGIVVVGLCPDKTAIVLDDLSGRLSPHDWGQNIVKAYHAYRADRVVAEVNKGGDLVERILKTIDPSISYKPVRATRGKITRAEPIAALYEQQKVFHAKVFSQLESQLCTYCPDQSSKSPDRLDALVWGLTELFLEHETKPILKIWGA
jgi:phage terminase large subunit-like protein